MYSRTSIVRVMVDEGLSTEMLLSISLIASEVDSVQESFS